jgi:hypothetical protein
VVILIMISNLEHAQDLDFAQVMSRKSSARDRQVEAACAADPAALEQAAARIKAVWRGQSRALVRPKRFSALGNDA